MRVAVVAVMIATGGAEPGSARQNSKPSWNNLKQLERGNQVQVLDRDGKARDVGKP
jgi:hypothetical protein